ncbi:molybdenum cofactor guanylyltransferase MobA [Pararhizobium sp. A13]|uniref:molybdenum cofactor guanylyltransferase MobA n=1 Tax=Pararhizobium sp. A13 TaxID=3133975 RepID=UPI00324FAC11
MSASAIPTADRPPAVILAGGRSSRMGSDKAAVTLDGIQLLCHVIERLASQVAGISVNSNAITGLDFAPRIAVFADDVPGYVGPMAGVLSAMRHTARHFPSASHVVTVPTDTPFFPHDLVARLQGAITLPAQIAVACSAGVMHPVFALWPVDLAGELEHWLLTDEKRRVRSFIESHAMAEVDFPMLETATGPIDPFFNINTPADLETAEHWLPLIEDMER